MKKKTNMLSISILYVGAIMGAGFASGRESWQFFGIFGNTAVYGIIIVGMMFSAIGAMVAFIARKKDTSEMGEIVVPGNSKFLSKAVSIVMSAMLYPVIITMSAAGGSFLKQQFGLRQAVGGIVIVFLVIVTVLGNFDRISKVFKYIIPILFVIDVGYSFIVMTSPIEQSGATEGFQVSSMASNWIIAAFVFLSYNMVGMVPVVGEAARRADSTKSAMLGAAIGGIMLGLLTLMLVKALQKDMAFTDSMDLPMLAFSARIGKVANAVFGLVLVAAIYSAATSTYYGFSTVLPKNRYKKYIMISGAIVGFFFSLIGFKNVIGYIYPVEGYIGIVLIILIIADFFYTAFNYRRKDLD